MRQAFSPLIRSPRDWLAVKDRIHGVLIEGLSGAHKDLIATKPALIKANNSFSQQHIADCLALRTKLQGRIRVWPYDIKKAVLKKRAQTNLTVPLTIRSCNFICNSVLPTPTEQTRPSHAWNLVS